MRGAETPSEELGVEGRGGVAGDGDFEHALFEEYAEVGE